MLRGTAIANGVAYNSDSSSGERMKRLMIAIAVLAAPLAGAPSAFAAPPVCAPASGGAGSDPNGPPSGKVKVVIESFKLNSDLDPSYIFWTDHSDVFGKVTINADGTPESFKLPEIEDTEAPTWNGDTGTFVSRPAIPGQKVHITIHLEEDDWGLTGSNDSVDVSPAAHDDLELDLDTCAMVVSGDIPTQSASGALHVKAGTAGNQGLLTFRIEMEDHRALSAVKNDIVLQGFDLIQVLPDVDRLVGGKPVMGLVTVANNTPSPQTVSFHVRVIDSANATLFDVAHIPMGTALQPGEVRSQYIGPFNLNDYGCKDATVIARANLEIGTGQQDPGGRDACWVMNDSSGIRTWSQVTTYQPSLLWLRTGDVLIANSLVTTQQQKAIHDLSIPFIRAIYPTKAIGDSVTTIPVIPPLSGGVYGLLSTLLDALGLPLDAAKPYTIIYELSYIASLIGVDKIMGSVPKGYFGLNLYGINQGITGLSLGTIAPHAVLFEAWSDGGGTNVGPALALPAHEMGHTYGLSLDPNIKNWACYLPGALGVIGCAMGGGYDEYKDSTYPNGIPTWGYWIPQDPMTLSQTAGEQCGTWCLMGGSNANAETDWHGARNNWVDAADYNHLVDEFNEKSCVATGASGVLYVSGAIASDNSAVLGWMAALPAGSRAVDFPNKPGRERTIYGVRMVGASGATLSESELPLGWPLADNEIPLEATLFGGYVDFPTGTAKIQLWNRQDNKLLAERAVSVNPPVVSAPKMGIRLSGRVRWLDLNWAGSDKDGDALSYFVVASSDRGAHWAPVAHALGKPGYSLDLTDVPSGSYIFKVIATDGVNIGSASNSITL